VFNPKIDQSLTFLFVKALFLHVGKDGDQALVGRLVLLPVLDYIFYLGNQMIDLVTPPV
jgi:hypothetical protein